MPQLGDARGFIIGKNFFQPDELQPHQKEAIQKIASMIEYIRARTVEVPRLVEDSGRDFAWYSKADRPTQVFSIFGDRGQGKTATLITLCAQLSSLMLEGRHPYLVIPALEPEIMQPGEDVFSAIAFNLRVTVEHMFSDQGSSSLVASREAYALRQGLDELVEQSLSFSREGKGLLMELSGNLETYTKRLVERQSESLRRVQRLHLWIDRLLAQTAREILVFPIDDVDISREHSEGILQAVRIYLSHPRVIVIITAEIDAIRRAIRNRLLKELPPVFTGGDSSVPAKEGQETFSLFGRGREQILEREYRADDEYAQQFLYKVAPPAYRVQLRGLRADERQTVRFSIPVKAIDHVTSVSSTVSLEEILSEMPLLSDVVGQSGDKVEWQDLRTKFVQLAVGVNSSTREYAPVLPRICRLYPEVFSPILRVLLNQIIFLRDTVHEHKRIVLSIIESGATLDTWGQPVSRAGLSFERELEWPTSLSQIEEEGGAALRGIKRAEESSFMKLIQGLAMNPSIEVDRPLFFNIASQSNAFDAKSASEFWLLTENLQVKGTAGYGFMFSQVKATGERELLSGASSCLFNIFLEYAILRHGSPWIIFKKVGIDLEPSDAAVLRRGAFCAWLDKELPAGGDRLTKILGSSIRDHTQLERSIGEGNSYFVHFRSTSLGPPCFIESAAEAAKYYHSSFHRNAIERVEKAVEEINAQLERLYKPREKDGDEKVLPQTSAEIARQERDIVLRILGLLTRKMNDAVAGIANAMLPRGYSLSAQVDYGEARADLPWFVSNMEAPGGLIQAVLRDDNRSIETRLAILLFFANLPIAPLLTAWKQLPDSEVDAYSLLDSIINLISAIKNKWGNDNLRHEGLLKIEINLRQRKDARQWQHVKGRPSVVLEGLDQPECPIPIRRMVQDVPRCNLQNQVIALRSFLDLLVELQAHPSSYASATRPPSSWVKFAEYIASEEVIRNLLHRFGLAGSEDAKQE